MSSKISQQQKKNKKNGKKIAHPDPKTSLPVQARVTANSLHSYRLEPDTEISQVLYKKQSLTQFGINLNDVPLRSEKSKRAYDIHFRIPSSDLGSIVEDPSNIVHMGHCVITLENICDFVLYIRLQRPLGFITDPYAIAIWEAISMNGREFVIQLKPQSKRQFSFSNSGNDTVVPRLSTMSEGSGRSGFTALQLASLCVFREAVNIHGNDPFENKERGLALDVNVEVNYHNYDNKSGTVKKIFAVETHSECTYMDHVAPSPAVPIRICDTLDIAGKVDGMCIWPIGKVAQASIVIPGTDANTLAVPLALSTDVVYALPYIVAGGNSIKYNTDSSQWVVHNITYDDKYKIIAKAVPAPTGKYYIDGNLHLTPLGANKYPALNNCRYKTKPIRAMASVKLSKTMLEATKGETITDTILDGIVVVLSVVRDALMFATAIGLLKQEPSVLVG